jgi:hypothetical protein
MSALPLITDILRRGSLLETTFANTTYFSLSKKNDKNKFSVLVLDNYHFANEDEEILVTGFSTLEAAREYARRRTRDSMEELRAGSSSTKDLRDRWSLFGENCLVVGGDYAGGSELEFFAESPASPEEINWLSLKPKRATEIA